MPTIPAEAHGLLWYGRHERVGCPKNAGPSAVLPTSGPKADGGSLSVLALPGTPGGCLLALRPPRLRRGRRSSRPAGWAHYRAVNRSGTTRSCHTPGPTRRGHTPVPTLLAGPREAKNLRGGGLKKRLGDQASEGSMGGRDSWPEKGVLQWRPPTEPPNRAAQRRLISGQRALRRTSWRCRRLKLRPCGCSLNPA
jgi:hypothetical protein